MIYIFNINDLQPVELDFILSSRVDVGSFNKGGDNVIFKGGLEDPADSPFVVDIADWCIN